MLSTTRWVVHISLFSKKSGGIGIGSFSVFVWYVLLLTVSISLLFCADFGAQLISWATYISWPGKNELQQPQDHPRASGSLCLDPTIIHYNMGGQHGFMVQKIAGDVVLRTPTLTQPLRYASRPARGRAFRHNEYRMSSNCLQPNCTLPFWTLTECSTVIPTCPEFFCSRQAFEISTKRKLHWRNDPESPGLQTVLLLYKHLCLM